MGQISEEELKNISPSKNKSRYQLTSVIYLALVLPSAFLGMFSVFMFDAPGSENNKALVSLVTSIFLFAPVLLICGIGGLTSLKGMVEDKPSIKNKVFLWFPICHFALNLILMFFV